MHRLLAHSDFATVPLAIVAVAACRPPARLVDILLLATGWLAWTLIEYGVHRAMHMRRFPKLRRIHVGHHQHPKAPSGGTLYSSATILVLIVAAILVPWAAPAILGLLAGYLVFIVLHHAEHHGWSLPGPLRRLAAAHDLHHHAGPNRMFGVSTTLWDRVFGTC